MEEANNQQLGMQLQTEINITKLSAIILIWLMCVIVGILPILNKKLNTNVKLMGAFNSFAAGVFLTVGLILLMPQAIAVFADISFPWPFLIAIMSFSLILFVEKIAFDAHELVHDEEGGHGHDHDAKKLDKHALHDKKHLKKVKASIAQLCNISLCVIKEHGHGEKGDKKDPLLMGYDKDALDEDHEHEHDKEEVLFKEIMSTKSRLASKMSYVSQAKRSRIIKRSRLHLNVPENDSDDEDDDHHDHKAPVSQSALTPYLLCIALSLHGIFEGFAIGVQSTLKETLSLTIAILLHKWAEALTLGISFAKGKVEKKHAISMIIIFGSASPIGIALGWIFADSNKYLPGIFMAIACGTFLYISSAEIIVEEFSVSKHKWLKFGCYLIGIALIVGLYFVDN